MHSSCDESDVRKINRCQKLRVVLWIKLNAFFKTKILLCEPWHKKLMLGGMWPGHRSESVACAYSSIVSVWKPKKNRHQVYIYVTEQVRTEISKSGLLRFLESTSDTRRATSGWLYEIKKLRFKRVEIRPPVFSGAIVGWYLLIPSGKRQTASPVSRAYVLRQEFKVYKKNSNRPYLHKFKHCVRVIRSTIGGVFPSFNWNSSGSLDQPAGECSVSELSSFCSQAQHVTFLWWRYSMQDGEVCTILKYLKRYRSNQETDG